MNFNLFHFFPKQAAGMGMGGLSPAAALAMAASGNPAASAAAANILQV